MFSEEQNIARPSKCSLHNSNLIWMLPRHMQLRPAISYLEEGTAIIPAEVGKKYIWPFPNIKEQC